LPHEPRKVNKRRKVHSALYREPKIDAPFKQHPARHTTLGLCCTLLHPLGIDIAAKFTHHQSTWGTEQRCRFCAPLSAANTFSSTSFSFFVYFPIPLFLLSFGVTSTQVAFSEHSQVWGSAPRRAHSRPRCLTSSRSSPHRHGPRDSSTCWTSYFKFTIASSSLGTIQDPTCERQVSMTWR